MLYDILVADMAKVWKEEGWSRGEQDEKKIAVSIIDKFKYILENKLMLKKGEIEWFKKDSGNPKSQYIFRSYDSYSLAETMDEIFGLFDKYVLVTSKVEDMLKTDLIEILPIADNDPRFDECEKRINEAVDVFSRKSWEKYLSEKNWGRILYRKNYFVDVNARQVKGIKARRDIYKYQYKEMVKWRQKWSFIMDIAKKIRSAERYDNGHDQIENSILYEYILNKFYGRWSDPGKTNENVKEAEYAEKNSENCCEECEKLFTAILYHQLLTVSKNDFDYILEKAIDDLRVLCDRVERRQCFERYRSEFDDMNNQEKEKISKPNAATYCEMVKGGKKEDVDMLYEIRRELNNKKIWIEGRKIEGYEYFRMKRVQEESEMD